MQRARRASFETGVAKIMAVNGVIRGTGFAVEPAGLVVTCAHVVDAALGRRGGTVEMPTESVYVKFLDSPESPLSASIIAWQPERDIAVLHLEQGLPLYAIPLALGSAEHTDNQSFYCFGFPQEHDNGLADRNLIVRSLSHAEIQLRSDVITRGFSGAPVLSETTGFVVGMISGVTRPDDLDRKRSTALAIPADLIAKAYPINLSESSRRKPGFLPSLVVGATARRIQPLIPARPEELEASAEIDTCACVERYIVARHVEIRNWAEVKEGFLAIERAEIGHGCLIDGHALAGDQIDLGYSVVQGGITAPTVRLTGLGCRVAGVLACDRLEVESGALLASHAILGSLLCKGDVVIALGARNLGSVVAGGMIRASDRVEARCLIAYGDVVVGDDAVIVLARSYTGSVILGARARAWQIICKGHVHVGDGSHIGSIQAEGDIRVDSGSIVDGQILANGTIRLSRGVRAGYVRAASDITMEAQVHLRASHLLSESGAVKWQPPLQLAKQIVTEQNRFLITTQNHIVPYRDPVPAQAKCYVSSRLTQKLLSLTQDRPAGRRS